MDFAAFFYPSLSESRRVPALYLPISFYLTLVPFLFSSRRLGIMVTFSILLLFCIRAPFYTFGNPSADYYDGGPFLALILWYLDFIVLTLEMAPMRLSSSELLLARPRAKDGPTLVVHCNGLAGHSV